MGQITEAAHLWVALQESGHECWLKPWSVFPKVIYTIWILCQFFFPCRLCPQPGFHMAEYCTVLINFFSPWSRGNMLARIQCTVLRHLFWVPKECGSEGILSQLPSGWLIRGLFRRLPHWCCSSAKESSCFQHVFSLLLLFVTLICLLSPSLLSLSPLPLFKVSLRWAYCDRFLRCWERTGTELRLSYPGTIFAFSHQTCWPLPYRFWAPHSSVLPYTVF